VDRATRKAPGAAPGSRAKKVPLGPYRVPFTDEVPRGPFAATLRSAVPRGRRRVRSKQRAARAQSPSVDLVGPKAEAALKAWLEAVDYEPPLFLAAWETDETTTFLLSGFVPGGGPLPSYEDEASDQNVSFTAETGWIETARGLERRVSAAVTGPATPRLLPSRFAQADGVLVPVGFGASGTLHLPLLGPVLAVGGRDGGELLRSLVILAAVRLGRGALRALAARQLTSLLEAAGEIDTISESEADASDGQLQQELEARRLSFWNKGASNFREHALIRRGPNHPVLVVARDERFTATLEDQSEDGVAAVMLGESKAARRSITVAKSRCRIDPGLGLGSFTLIAPVLSSDALIEAAHHLRASGPPASAAGLPAHVERVGFVSNAPLIEPPIRIVPRPADAQERIGAERPVEPAGREAEVTLTRRMYLLGRPRVELNGQEIEARLRQKSLELVALLAAQPGGMVKDAVLETLWPEGDPQKSDANLRQCLSDIRKHLGYVRGTDMVIERVGELLRLDQDGVWTDIAAFSEAIEAAASSDDPTDDLRRAAELYHGEFCQGTYSWSETIREHLRRLFMDAAVRLSDILAEQDEFNAAIDALDRAIASDKYAEHLYRRAMILESKRGRRDGVVRRFRRLERLLSQDLEVTPEAETVALFQSLTG
jgi:DNA-binding SARP family transcriptional activator